MALSLGPAESPVGVPARCARWDPNLPDAVGVSHEDGTFTYFLSGGRSVRLQLFTLRHSTPAASGERPGLVTPAAVHAPWSLWSFIRGCPGRLLLCLRHSPHVFTTQISLQQLPTIGAGQQAQFPHVIASSSVQEVAELEGDSALTALTVSSCGCFGATGSLDGRCAASARASAPTGTSADDTGRVVPSETETPSARWPCSAPVHRRACSTRVRCMCPTCLWS